MLARSPKIYFDPSKFEKCLEVLQFLSKYKFYEFHVTNSTFLHKINFENFDIEFFELAGGAPICAFG